MLAKKQPMSDLKTLHITFKDDNWIKKNIGKKIYFTKSIITNKPIYIKVNNNHNINLKYEYIYKKVNVIDLK